MREVSPPRQRWPIGRAEAEEETTQVSDEPTVARPQPPARQ
jgi:hypothetical protein